MKKSRKRSYHVSGYTDSAQGRASFSILTPRSREPLSAVICRLETEDPSIEIRSVYEIHYD